MQRQMAVLAPEDEIAYVIKAFSTIVEKGGAYQDAFADPFYVMEGLTSVAMTVTTTKGNGNIYTAIYGPSPWLCAKSLLCAGLCAAPYSLFACSSPRAEASPAAGTSGTTSLARRYLAQPSRSHSDSASVDIDGAGTSEHAAAALPHFVAIFNETGFTVRLLWEKPCLHRYQTSTSLEMLEPAAVILV